MADWVETGPGGRELRQVVEVGMEFRDLHGRVGRLVEIVNGAIAPYKVMYSGAHHIHSYHGDLTVVAYRCPDSEADWIVLDERTPLRSLGLSPGDLFKRQHGVVYQLKQMDYGSLRSYVFQLYGGSDERRSNGHMLIEAYARFKEPGVSEKPAVARHPRITEVVCTVCGRPLGEFSDGTVPRSKRGKCCTGTSERWSEERMLEYTEGPAGE